MWQPSRSASRRSKSWPPTGRRYPLVLASPHSGTNYPPDFIAASRLDPLKPPPLGRQLCRRAFRRRARTSARRCSRRVSPAPISTPIASPSSSIRRCSRTRCPISSTAIRRGCASASARSRALSPRARKSMPASCALPRRCSGSSGSTALITALSPSSSRRRATASASTCCSIAIRCPRPPCRHATGWGAGRVDIVLGDCHGTSCDPVVADTAQRVLVDRGYAVVRNAPYAGGFTTTHYGKPGEGGHCLQIEIGRGLYMDERSYERKAVLRAARQGYARSHRRAGRHRPVAVEARVTPSSGRQCAGAFRHPRLRARRHAGDHRDLRALRHGLARDLRRNRALGRGDGATPRRGARDRPALSSSRSTGTGVSWAMPMPRRFPPPHGLSLHARGFDLCRAHGSASRHRHGAY